MKKVILFLFLTVMMSSQTFFAGNYVYATGETASSSSWWWTFEIIPESEVSDSKVWEAVEKVWKAQNWVWKEYNSQASELPLWWQFASWIMNWDTILNYAVYLVKFLFQLWLFVGAVMIVYAWYLYTLWAFTSEGKANEGKTAIKLAIIGTLVVLFSYAIMKILTSMFL